MLNIYQNDSNIAQLRSFVSAFAKGEVTDSLMVRGLICSAQAIAVAESQSKRNIVVCPSEVDAPFLYGDLVNLLGEEKVVMLPSSFRRNISRSKYNSQNTLLRTETLSRLLNSDGDVTVVTSAQALTEKVVSRQQLESNTLVVKQGETVSIAFLVDTLLEYGFQRVDFVYEPGQFSVRGSIVDVFSYSSDVPYRIDFFGNEVDSLRSFELDSQLSIQKLNEVTIVPNINIGSKDANLQLLPLLQVASNYLLWVIDPEECEDVVAQVRQMAVVASEMPVSGDEDTEGVVGRVSVDDFITTEDFRYSLTQPHVAIYPDIKARDLETREGVRFLNFGIRPQPLFKKNFDLLIDDIYLHTTDGYEVYVLSDNARQLERLRDILSERRRKLNYSEVRTVLHQGFIDTVNRRCVYTDHQIFERFHKVQLKTDNMRRQQQSITLRELQQLNVGDYVVHIDHGIGVFGGLVLTEANGRKFEAIRISFADGDNLFVNVQQLYKISKYRGKEGAEPKINRLGNSAWSRLKEKTKKHVKDIAANLISLYARRKEEQGFAFSPDSFMQTELEASFLYEDTPDQYKATQAIKHDMESSSPMDRLVCGDVGFGKTELAIRAAFKAVADNKQVAVLVPTTVLAFQHYNTFRSRLKDFPCKVEYISRLRKTSEVRQVLKRLKDGDVDVVIGTHRLIGKDVEFKDLGLLIIDEEQRFGVSVKEKLREMKVNVDTLTLSATPIPRTLQFSLMGARDLSVLQTPPANRQPVVTMVETFSEEAMVQAISQEVARGGQVFVINNRIAHLLELQRIIGKLMPDVRTVVGHGQMEGAMLESIMLDFIDGSYDVLLATTIIESGLDIPNANTIIINNAHQFGLSELHQLRGRVGRSNKKAYCYLFAPPMSTLTQEARRRLKIIGEFSDLGSGFNIAMQDMDIRGTGDVLGAEQSGFISDIGYETYQKILAEALVELKQNEYKELFANNNMTEDDADEGGVAEPVQAGNFMDYMFLTEAQVDADEQLLLPEEYVANVTERMRLYKELSCLTTAEAIDGFRNHLIDRFGAMPAEGENLIMAAHIRIIAVKIGVERVLLKNGKLVMYLVNDIDSAYYQSPLFASVLAWVQMHAKDGVSLSPSGKPSLVFKGAVYTVESTLELIKSIVEFISR